MAAQHRPLRDPLRISEKLLFLRAGLQEKLVLVLLPVRTSLKVPGHSQVPLTPPSASNQQMVRPSADRLALLLPSLAGGWLPDDDGLLHLECHTQFVTAAALLEPFSPWLSCPQSLVFLSADCGK